MFLISAYNPAWTLLALAAMAAAVRARHSASGARTRYRLYRTCGWSAPMAALHAIRRRQP